MANLATGPYQVAKKVIDVFFIWGNHVPTKMWLSLTVEEERHAFWKKTENFC